MIVKVTRGVSAAKALAYDYGPGRSMEHHNPRRVAGTVPGRDWRGRGRGMQELLRETGDTRQGGPKRVFRLAVSVAPEDRIMPDREWSQIAARVVGEFTRGDPHGYHWEAVRHDPRHIHITLLHRGVDGRVFREGLYKTHCLKIAAGLERDYGLREVDHTRRFGPQARHERSRTTAAARAKYRARARVDTPQRQPPSRNQRLAAALEEARRRDAARQQQRGRDDRDRGRER